MEQEDWGELSSTELPPVVDNDMASSSELPSPIQAVVDNAIAPTCELPPFLSRRETIRRSRQRSLLELLAPSCGPNEEKPLQLAGTVVDADSNQYLCTEGTPLVGDKDSILEDHGPLVKTEKELLDSPPGNLKRGEYYEEQALAGSATLGDTS